ncbi:MAG: hypothetical protein IKS52_03145 [Clostridia bacterium]|nr:hypothetical protein [Clostridia bacterium]
MAMLSRMAFLLVWNVVAIESSPLMSDLFASFDSPPQIRPLSPDEWRAVFLVDLANLLLSVDVSLIKAVYPPAAPIVAAGTELAVNTASAPQRLMDDLDALFPRRISDEDGFHDILPFIQILFLLCFQIRKRCADLSRRREAAMRDAAISASLRMIRDAFLIFKEQRHQAL